MAESVIFTDNTVLTINNDSTERTLWTTTILANSLLLTDALRITVWGEYRNDVGSPQNMTSKLYYGAAFNVATRDQQTASVGARDALWNWYLTMRGATNAQYIIDQWSDGAAGAWALTPPATDRTASVMDFAFGGNNIAIDSTVNQTLKMTFQLQTADPNLEIVYYATRIEQLTIGGGVGGGGGGGGGGGSGSGSSGGGVGGITPLTNMQRTQSQLSYRKDRRTGLWIAGRF